MSRKKRRSQPEKTQHCVAGKNRAPTENQRQAFSLKINKINNLSTHRCTECSDQNRPAIHVSHSTSASRKTCLPENFQDCREKIQASTVRPSTGENPSGISGKFFLHVTTEPSSLKANWIIQETCENTTSTRNQRTKDRWEMAATRYGQQTCSVSICPAVPSEKIDSRISQTKLVFDRLPFLSPLCHCFPTNIDGVFILSAGTFPVRILEILLPSPACKTCWVNSPPFVTVHFPVLLFLTPQTEVTTMQYFCHNV